MKQYIYTTSTYLLLLLLTGTCFLSSCSDEEAVGSKKMADNLSLSIIASVSPSIQTRATDDPATDTRNANGSWIKNFTIFLFATDATDSSTPLFTKTIQVTGNPAKLNQANQIQLTGRELSDAGIGIGSHVKIYAIANHIPANATTLTKKQVTELTITLPDYAKENAWGKDMVPMTGTNPDYEITENNKQTISLDMQRAVMRISIDITDAEFDNDKYDNGEYVWCITSVKLYNDYAVTYLWNEGIPSNPTCRTEEKAIGTTNTSYPKTKILSAGTFYLNCNETSVAHTVPDPIKIKIRGYRSNENSIETPFEYTIDLKKADGTCSFERNTKLTVNLTLNAGSVDIKTEALPWDDKIDANNVKELMDPEPKANSYIVKPNSAILIPVSQVQDVHAFVPKAGDNFAAAIGADETLTAELTWTDVKGTVSGKGLAEDASIAEIEVLGKGPDALLLIVTGTQLGNSVVSVLQSGVFRWSWHIWVTEYDPETTNIKSGSYTFMDRNLGALTNTPDPNGHNSTGVVGTYYQWGRPTPLQSKDRSSTSATVSSPAPVYDADGNIVATRTTTNNINSIGNPRLYFHNFYSEKRELWDTNGQKTALDPCPPGWRVPVKEAWDNIEFNTIEASGVQTKSNLGFYPTSQAYMEVNKIQGWFKPFFWTASIGIDNSIHYSYNSGSAESNSISLNEQYDWYALPVRCVKE